VLGIEKIRAHKDAVAKGFLVILRDVHAAPFRS
jgi:hypothetical protein